MELFYIFALIIIFSSKDYMNSFFNLLMLSILVVLINGNERCIVKYVV